VTERLILILATLVLALIGLPPVAAMLKETLIADDGFSLNAFRALLTSDGRFALLTGAQPAALVPDREHFNAHRRSPWRLAR
jgi:hypothetical protein